MPATKPDTMQMALSQCPTISRRSSIPSINRLLPRDTNSPSNPAASAPPNASPSATRQATFLNGTSTVHSQVYTVQNG